MTNSKSENSYKSEERVLGTTPSHDYPPKRVLVSSSQRLSIVCSYLKHSIKLIIINPYKLPNSSSSY